MRKQLPRLETPLNGDERALYNVALRLERIIELLENVIEDRPEEVTNEVPKKKTTKKR